MVVGVCRITFLIPESHSLKEKRALLTRIKDKTRQKFHLAIAEVGAQDAWQSAQLGFAVVANERGFVESVVDKVAKFIEELAEAKVIDDEKDFIVYGEGELVSMDGFKHWEPDEPSPVPQRRAAGAGAGAGKPGKRERGRIPVRGARK